MVASSLLGPFRRIELFAGLTPFQVSEIARRSERVMFRSDDVIAKSGEASDAAILIVDGKVECTEGLPSCSKDPHIEPGTLLAEMAMFTEFEYAATFVARSSVKAIRITREEILAQMEDDPEMVDSLVSEVVGRLNQMAGELRKIDSSFEESKETFSENQSKSNNEHNRKVLTASEVTSH